MENALGIIDVRIRLVQTVSSNLEKWTDESVFCKGFLSTSMAEICFEPHFDHICNTGSANEVATKCNFCNQSHHAKVYASIKG